MSVYSGISVTQHGTCLGDTVCCNIGCMDVIATHVSVHLGWHNCVCITIQVTAYWMYTSVQNSVPVGLLVSV